MGTVERNEYKDHIKYTIFCKASYFRPDMEDLKQLQVLCNPTKMWIDTGANKIYMEYKLG